MFLCNLMDVYITFERFLLVTFDLLAIFDPIWGYLGPFWDHFLDQKNGHFGDDFGPLLTQSEVILGSLWDHFGIDLGSF